MADIQVITPERHGHKYWRKHSGYGFAAADALCPLVIQELTKAVLSLPIGFIAEGDGYIPVAVQGLNPGKNLFVAPNGQWLTNYIPAPYRAYPFHLATTDDGQYVLCVDEASDLVVDSDGEAFFNEDGTPNQSILDIFKFFTEIEANRVATRSICAVLQRHNLIQPWVITLKDDQANISVNGLFRIDESIFHTLSSDALLEIRDVGGLTMIYSQLLSVQHLPSLGLLAQGHAEAERNKLLQKDKLNLGFIKGGDTFSFGE